MTSQWEPWRRLLPAWLPAMVLCICGIGYFFWQSSGTVGTEVRLSERVGELRRELAQLRRIEERTRTEREELVELDAQLAMLYTDVFGSLDERLTNILRELEKATRAVGLRPNTFNYSAQEERDLPFIRFSVRFSVSGEYSQVRQMLAAVRQSPEFLMVDHIALTGEQDARTSAIAVSVEISTYLNQADMETVRALNRGWLPEGGTDG